MRDIMTVLNAIEKDTFILLQLLKKMHIVSAGTNSLLK
jgi:hypothetical protein